MTNSALPFTKAAYLFSTLAQLRATEPIVSGLQSECGQQGTCFCRVRITPNSAAAYNLELNDGYVGCGGESRAAFLCSCVVFVFFISLPLC